MKSELVMVAAAMAAAYAGSAEIEDVCLLSEPPAWNAKSRAETMAWFLENEYGVRPEATAKPDLAFAPICPDRTVLDGAAVRTRVRITCRGPYGTNSFDVTAFVPTAGKGPKPAFLHTFNHPEADIIDPDRTTWKGAWPVDRIVARGYAAIAFDVCQVAPDYNTGNREGVFASYEKPGAANRPTNAWGTLSAWAWAASRVMDWIETRPELVAKRVAVIGLSRGGKTALLAGVTDGRFAMACVNNSGCSGAKLQRADLPESEHIHQICRYYPYWFCANYISWANLEREIECDQHQWLALMAPRPVAVASATVDNWAGQRGEYASCVFASGAWEAHGRKGLVAPEGYPQPEHPLQEGWISYHLRTGPHNLTAYDWERYMDFADKRMKADDSK